MAKKHNDKGYLLWKNLIADYKKVDPDTDITYDYEGYYNKYPGEAWSMLRGDSEAHFPDEFKTVYHPTFSILSSYSGKVHPLFNPKGLEGGTWKDNNTFVVSDDLYKSPVNMDQRIDYLINNEPNGAILRESDGSLPYMSDGTFYGGVLPEVTVTPKKYDTGGPLKAPLDWNELTMKEKAAFIRMGVSSGYKDIDSIRKIYNEFKKGGKKLGASEDISKKIFLGTLNESLRSERGRKEFSHYDTPEWRRYLTELALKESSYRANVFNDIGALGYFQLMPANRSNKGGRWWNDRTLLFYDMYKMTDTNYKLLKKLMKPSDWTKAASLGIDIYGLLGGAHLGGVGGVIKALRGVKNAKDKNGSSVLGYMRKFSLSNRAVPESDIQDIYPVMHQDTNYLPSPVYELLYTPQAILSFNLEEPLITIPMETEESPATAVEEAPAIKEPVYREVSPLDMVRLFNNQIIQMLPTLHQLPTTATEILKLWESLNRNKELKLDNYILDDLTYRGFNVFDTGGDIIPPIGSLLRREYSPFTVYGRRYYTDEDLERINKKSLGGPIVTVANNLFDGGGDKENPFIKYVDSYRVNPETGGVYDKTGEVKEGAVILPEVEVIGKPIGKEAIRREAERMRAIQGKQGLSGADPLGQFVVETAALSPVFKGLEVAGLYGLGRYGEAITGFAKPQNWAREKLISDAMERSLTKPVTATVSPEITSYWNPSLSTTEEASSINWEDALTPTTIATERGRKKYLDWINSPSYRQRLQEEPLYKHTDYILDRINKLTNNLKFKYDKNLEQLSEGHNGIVAGETTTKPAKVLRDDGNYRIFDLNTGLGVNIANDLGEDAEDTTVHELLHYITVNSKGIPEDIGLLTVVDKGWANPLEILFGTSGKNIQRGDKWQSYILDQNNSLLPEYDQVVNMVMKNPQKAKEYLIKAGRTESEAIDAVNRLRDRYSYWSDIQEQRAHLQELFISKIRPNIKNPNDAAEVEKYLLEHPEILENSAPYKHIQEVRPGSVKQYAKYFASALSTAPFIYNNTKND